jgi:chitosanase
LIASAAALRKVDGTDSHAGLGSSFTSAWKTAAKDTVFQQAQNDERDRVYFNPSVNQAKSDGLRALGQFIYYDAIVMHGQGDDSVSFGGIRKTAMKKAKSTAGRPSADDRPAAPSLCSTSARWTSAIRRTPRDSGR